jgi:glycosyltransferase involved in cell wall biosynthesis
VPLKQDTTAAGQRVVCDRIVILVDEFPPAIAGGIATWALELSNALVALGYRVTVMAPRKLLSRAPRAVCAAEVNYIGWHDWPRYRGLYSLLGILPLLPKRESLVIVGSTWQHLTAISAFRKFIGAKVVCFTHGTDATRAITPPRRRHFEHVLRRVDLFAPTSEFLQTMVKKSFPGIDIPTSLVYNGIDTNHFRPQPEAKAAFRAALSLDLDALVIASAGRFIKAKGFDTLIQAIDIARRQCADIHLCIAGKLDGEYEPLKALVAALGVSEHVHFVGPVSYEKLPEFYNAADIGVLASIPLYEPFYIEESFGLVLAEAAACGLPLVGTRCGGIPEIVADGECGYVVAPGDAQALAERICTLGRDGALRARMGQAARARTVRYFNREGMTGAFLAAVAKYADAAS